MYVENSNLGDLKSFHKKARELVHKVFPRELSPTRLLEQYQTKQKKKAKSQAAVAKLQLETTQREALETVKKAGEQLVSVSSLSPSDLSQSAAGTGGAALTGGDAASPSISPVFIVGAVGGVLALWILTRKKS